MKTNEHDYYSRLDNWSFEDIDYTSEIFTNWIYEEEIKKHVNKKLKVLDLGTAGIEKEIFEKYVKENINEKGIKLVRRYYGIIGRK
ncbi:MAG: hypothetical protein ACI4UE_04460 [Candidatus Scatovivens sp.]